jgi:ubiquinone/menaquinone biosynthesis C-methylase UbiE
MSRSTDHTSQVIDQFSQQAEGYSRLTASVPSDRSAALRALIRPCLNDVALEICCGPGALALEFAPDVKHATGLDLTPAMLEQAKLKQLQKGIDNVDWIVGDANSIPFEDAHFSIVLCSAAFHHLEQPHRVFAEMVRVCRSGGHIAVRDVTPASAKAERYDSMEKMRDPSHVHALTVDEMRGLGSGLPVEEVSITTSLTAHLPFEAILATSFPTTCSREDILSILREDALSGIDRLGFGATLIDGQVRVSYPVSTGLWRRQ